MEWEDRRSPQEAKAVSQMERTCTDSNTPFKGREENGTHPHRLAQNYNSACGDAI